MRNLKHGYPSSAERSAMTLLRDVDEFLKYVAIVKTPEVDRVRADIVHSLGNAQQELLDTVARVHGKGSAGVASQSLREYPWTAAAAAALLGAWFGRALRHGVR